MEEVVISGGKRTRTADILLAKQALYQLSYTPNIEIWAILDLNQGPHPCLLYTSDAADERSSVDLGGRRIIKNAYCL